MTSLSLSTRAVGLPRSGIRAMAELAGQTDGAIRLDIGDPDFATPRHIVEAVARAASDGETHYGPAAGLPSLRAAVADASSVTPAQVVVTAGAAGGLSCALLALLDVGDEVLLPDPGWANLTPMALAAGAIPVLYPLDRTRGFEPDLDALSALIGPRTRALVLNTPGNPTGAVLRREVVAAVAELAFDRGLWLISDECYDQLVFAGEHVTASSVAPDPGSVVTVRSFSKTYAMTGWRIGYVLAAEPVAELVARVQEATISCVATPVQKGAEAALAGPRTEVEEMRFAYSRRRDLAFATLDAHQVDYVRPDGAFYVMIDVSGSGLTSATFAENLLREERVAVVAGSAFGPHGEGLIRVSFAAPDASIESGLETIGAALVRQAAA